MEEGGEFPASRLIGTAPLNYRHAFHAGNFADLVKHALLLAALARLGPAEPRLEVIDTHAGAGLYDLQDEAAQRSGEAEAGVARLMAAADAPEAFTPLIAAVQACNPDGVLRRYPGSPWLAARALRRGQRYIGCELRPDDHARLAAAALQGVGRARGPAVERLCADGYAEAQRRLTRGAPTLLLVDPPYERADDYTRAAELIAARPRPDRQPALIWTPLKDLETFDAFLGRLEAARPASLVVAEARLRPLRDPMRMNGCAVALVDAPDVTAQARAVCGWAASALGEAGAAGRVTRLAGS